MLGISTDKAEELSSIDTSQFPAFDLEAMVDCCLVGFELFAKKYSDITFCAAAISASGYITFNAETNRGVKADKFSHGDGVFLSEGYDEEGSIDFEMAFGIDERQETQFYKAAMALIRRLTEENAFRFLKTSDDFTISVAGLSDDQI